MELHSTATTPAHILLVEDDMVYRNLLQEGLNLMGYRVSIAQNGQEALNALSPPTTKPDLILCDYHLVDLTACELMATLYTVWNMSRIPIIILSGEVNPHQRCPEHTTHMDAFLVKPFSLFRLQSIIEQLLGSRDSHA